MNYNLLPLSDSSPTSITVGIPFYRGNELQHLRQAIDSILHQTVAPNEIHLIQDGEVAEELRNLVYEYVESYSCIKLFVIPQNVGLARVINLSILNSTSTYYARMDADDIAHPKRLEKQLHFLAENPHVDILGTWALEFEHDPYREAPVLRKVPTSPIEMRSLVHYRNPFIHPSVVFRRSVFAKTGLYNPNFRLEQDLELWTRAFKAQVGVANLPEPLLYYRFSKSTIKRRTSALLYQIAARYRYNTWSPKLNLFKLLAIGFRILPSTVQAWGYSKLRA